MKAYQALQYPQGLRPEHRRVNLQVPRRRRRRKQEVTVGMIL
jgi:hypothetical protein